MREWLAIIVIVAIVLILADGFRRKLRARQALRSSLDQADDEASTELPSGGARIRPRAESPPRERHEPVFGDADLDEEVDAVSDTPAEDEAVDEEDFDNSRFMSRRHYVDPLDEPSEEAVVDEDMPEEEWETPGETAPTRRHDDQQQSELPLQDEAMDADDVDDDTEAAGEVEEVIIINVMAPRGAELSGREMLPVLLRNGLRLGDMSIFHRHVDSGGHGPVMFSMANMVKPGTFNMAQMEEFSTPGVSLFMQLPSRVAYMKSFDAMLEVATELKEELGGELKDENRSVLTRQTIEHYRQRIRDFELKQLSRSR